ncbi:hypothetical protein BD324DRAFT_639541 [Kockovaella imperatae]|uniref:Gfd2/YDR514C-like C-terminal domain-containing protein n=1 Tax=Kockovaella imperatae TaxID=4999 RepID=A0A1Y1U7K6_9TREE|nr:hypothetical protein BD324DRAFT_639541 [Kockovaella imperatae]ORX33487.1 hypothetical protein BD324DRAFT_639541 [Kockovaella imperatae]
MFIGTEKDGSRRLLMSLKQMEFLQLYIHDMRLADPIWSAHLAKKQTAQPGDLVEDDTNVGPAQYPEGGEWVPLPNNFIRREDLTSLETITFEDERVMKRVESKLRRQNQNIKKQSLLRDTSTATTDYDRAVIDNNTPGPGLKHGVQKALNVQSNDPSRKGWEEDERLISGEKGDAGEGVVQTGGGGFPLVPADEMKKAEDNPDKAVEGSDTALTAVKATDILADNTGSTKEEPNTAYYHLAQQALTVAALGGMFEAHKKQNPDHHIDTDPLDTLPPIGKGLFVSLHVVTWEADENVVLEVGWSGIWWQTKPEGGDCEEMRDRGHYIVQDHLLGKRNGMWKSDMRQGYLFGDSLPVAESELDTTIKALLADLAKKAGGGPTYLIFHGEQGLEKIGMKDMYDSLQPMEWDYPAFSCVDGIGKYFLIDTSKLFAAIEQRYHKQLAQSPRSLEEVGWIIFGQEKKRQPVGFGNAGNDAFYNLEVLLSILTGLSLDELRRDFVRSQKEAIKAAREADSPKAQGEGSKSIHSSAGDTTPLNSPSVGHTEDDETDSEEDMIKGVYFEDDEGELIELKE